MEDIKVFLPQINSGPDSAKHVITKDFNEATHALKAKGVLEHFAELGPCCIATADYTHCAVQSCLYSEGCFKDTTNSFKHLIQAVKMGTFPSARYRWFFTSSGTFLVPASEYYLCYLCMHFPQKILTPLILFLH